MASYSPPEALESIFRETVFPPKIGNAVPEQSIQVYYSQEGMAIAPVIEFVFNSLDPAYRQYPPGIYFVSCTIAIGTDVHVASVWVQAKNTIGTVADSFYYTQPTGAYITGETVPVVPCLWLIGVGRVGIYSPNAAASYNFRIQRWS